MVTAQQSAVPKFHAPLSREPESFSPPAERRLWDYPFGGFNHILKGETLSRVSCQSRGP
jgi:hypothetical protein